MDFIEISGTKYGGDELSDLTASSLIGIGISSFKTIDICAMSNSIQIDFKSPEDAHVLHAIAGSVPRFRTKRFKCQDARKFLLELYGVVNSWGYDQ